YPTQKPEPLISHLIADFAEPADLVVDPFAGAGTTLVCAWRAGHRAIGCDVREEACEVAARRLEREMAQGRINLPRRVVGDQPGLAF
ncbi:MAG TPA: DNA methyltransferase, partial [Nannocystis sp.]